MALFDQIALLDADHGPEIKQVIHEAQQNKASFKILFWAPLIIPGHTVLVQSAPGRWQVTNVHNMRMNAVQIRMSTNLWDEWPSHQAFLKWGSSMLGAQCDDWICFSMVYYVGSSLPSNFKELQYIFLQEKYAGEVEQHYPGIRRLMHEFDIPVMQSAIQLQAILDSPDDQTAPRASSLFKRVIHSTQSFFVGTPNSLQRFSRRGSQVRLSSCHAQSIRHDSPTLPSWIH